MLDFLGLSAELTAEEQQTRQTVRDFLEAEALPEIARHWEEGRFPRGLVERLGQQGLLGASLPPADGGAGLGPVAYGLVMYELERVDSGLRSFVSVQSALVMYPIARYGSDEQKRRWLPGLARGQLVGCFGLTEASGGSDPAGNMQTRLRRAGAGAGYLLSGSKQWITSGSIADVALVWARDDQDAIRGVLVPRDSPGFTTRDIDHKMSLRASVTSELFFDEVPVPVEAVLPAASGLPAALACLTQARYGIAWGALGALEAVYQEALAFSQERRSFGQPIAARQLVQEKLVRMVSDHSRGLAYALQLGRLSARGQLHPAQVSLGKRDNVRAALQAARAAREILGAAGITTAHRSIRHMLNLETVDTYEGTHDIHTLIVGKHLTGHNAL